MARRTEKPVDNVVEDKENTEKPVDNVVEDKENTEKLKHTKIDNVTKFFKGKL